MAAERRYGSPGAFRRALTDKLKALSAASRWELPQLQRQIAYDRLLARLYLIDRRWIVKGATALLARDLGVRGTIDIDLYRDVNVDIALRELREAAASDLGDWFTFELGAAHAVSDGANGSRVGRCPGPRPGGHAGPAAERLPRLSVGRPRSAKGRWDPAKGAWV
jgi:hypothetical protein